jgi:hypothetical protein
MYQERTREFLVGIMNLLISELGCLAGVIALIVIAWHISHRHAPADYLQQAAKYEAQARERDLAGDHASAHDGLERKRSGTGGGRTHENRPRRRCGRRAERVQ